MAEESSRYDDPSFLLDPFGDVYAAEQQSAAQDEALAQREQLARESQDMFREQSQLGIEYIQSGADQGAAHLRGYADVGSDWLRYGLDQQLPIIDQAQQSALGSLYSGQEQARGDLSSGYGQARNDLGQLASLQGHAAGAAQAIGAYDVMGRQPGSLSSLYAQQQEKGLDGFEADRGYQFRKEQGEQAINNAASARGGRMSARTMQELGEFNQGLASEEYDKFANRRLSMNAQQLGAAGQIDQQQMTALTNQAGRSDAASMQAQQNQMSLAQLGYGAQGQLAGLSAAQGQQMSGLADAYGRTQAGMQSAYGQQLSDLYGNYAGQNAQMYSGLGSQIGNLYANAGSNMANVAIGVGGNAQSNANNLMSIYGDHAQYGGMVDQAQANSNRETAAAVAAFASDIRLKTDIETIPSKYERIGLRGVRWVWNEIAGALGLFGRSEGVIAQDVQRRFPQAVGMRHGFMTVNYAELDRLVGEAS